MRHPPRSQRLGLLPSVLLVLACSAAPQSEFGNVGGALGNGGSSSNAAGAAGNASAAVCRPPVGTNGSPQTIEDAVTLLNALPKPTSIPCFLESLDRPLHASATSNTISAQPAFSAASPRIFLRLGQLVLSVVPEGDASHLIEFSYLLEGDARSIKGELSLPLTQAVPASAPYEHVLSTDASGRGGTVCGLCHGPEERVQSIDFTAAFSSVAFRPNPNSRVPLEALTQAQKSCDVAAQPERCAVLTALFGHGPVVQADFPSTMVLFE